MPSKKVLVIGNDERSFLSVIRSLGRAGLSVHINCASSWSIALHSKYITKKITLNSYSKDRDKWINEFILLLEKENYDLVIPCDDPALIPIYNHRQELEHFDCIRLLNEESYHIVFSKQKSYSLAKSLGVSVPKEIVISNIDDGKKSISSFSFPVVIKPACSFKSNDISIRHIVKKAYNIVEFEDILNESLIDGSVQIQQNIIGIGVGIELLVNDGDVLFAFQHNRIHEPLHGGGSSYRRSEVLDPGMYEASCKIMKALDYSGVAMIEYKYNIDNKKWYFIEINGRFWGSLPLALSAGADFPKFYYQSCVEDKQVFLQEYKIGVYCRNFDNDITWFLNNLEADHDDKTLSTIPVWKVFGELSNLFMLKEHSDTFVWDDPKPGIAELWIIIKRIIKKSLNVLNNIFLHLPFVRRIIIRKSSNVFRNGGNVLFICKGNICRSPFAELYYKSSAKDKYNIVSCGYYPVTDRTCPDNAITAAQELGIDLQQHRSKLLNKKMVDQADVIYIFDKENKSTLLSIFPHIKNKVIFLGLIFEVEKKIIDDPYGGTLDQFRKTYKIISQSIDARLKH